jgi:hypothetical protein
MDPIGHDDEKIHITVRSHPPLSGRAKKEDTGWLDDPYYSLHDIVEYLWTNASLSLHQLPPCGRSARIRIGRTWASTSG